MKNNNRINIGMKLLIRRYSKKFETEENLNYYSAKDFLRAKRKYLKFVIDGTVQSQDERAAAPF